MAWTLCGEKCAEWPADLPLLGLVSCLWGPWRGPCSGRRPFTGTCETVHTCFYKDKILSLRNLSWFLVSFTLYLSEDNSQEAPCFVTRSLGVIQATCGPLQCDWGCIFRADRVTGDQSVTGTWKPRTRRCSVVTTCWLPERRQRHGGPGPSVPPMEGSVRNVGSSSFLVTGLCVGNARAEGGLHHPGLVLWLLLPPDSTWLALEAEGTLPCGPRAWLY